MSKTLQSWFDLDARLSARICVAEQPGPLRTLAAFFAHSGDSWLWLLALSVVWWLGDGFWKARAKVMIGGILLTAVLVLVIKFTVRRQRPRGEWGNIYRITDPHSFPSGHATRAMMLAVLAVGLGPVWLGVTLAVWALLVALARVAMGIHYVSDMIAGAVLGMTMGGIGVCVFGLL
jgi:undecaprenyl-diphosphatase